jgi:hypothetical protein
MGASIAMAQSQAVVLGFRRAISSSVAFLAFGIGSRWSGQITRFGLQPLADDGGALLAILRPCRRKAVIDHVIAVDAERVLDNPGGTGRRRRS